MKPAGADHSAQEGGAAQEVVEEGAEEGGLADLSQGGQQKGAPVAQEALPDPFLTARFRRKVSKWHES
jgi:hypothetical protein